MVDLVKPYKFHNRILIDWLTVSFADYDNVSLISLLGLGSLVFRSASGSKLHYQYRQISDGLTIHFTDDVSSGKYNAGCCLELSGQGCRVFDQYASMPMIDFLRWSLLNHGHITRLDIAYDDFQGYIPLRSVAAQARGFLYTAKSQKLTITESCDNPDPDQLAVSVCHGSRSSSVYIRFYDKRAERHDWDTPHWVRCELQIRSESAMAAAWDIVEARGVGRVWAGILRQQVQYREPSEDSNRARWPLSPWYDLLVGAAERISLFTPCDTEYNRDRLDDHIYTRNHNALLAEMLADGLSGFTDRVVSAFDPQKMPDKYKSVVPILSELGDFDSDFIREYIKSGGAAGSSELLRHTLRKFSFSSASEDSSD